MTIKYLVQDANGEAWKFINPVIDVTVHKSVKDFDKEKSRCSVIENVKADGKTHVSFARSFIRFRTSNDVPFFYHGLNTELPAYLLNDEGKTIERIR